MKPQHYNPDWPLIPIEYKWVGVDRGGQVSAFIHKPVIDIRRGIWQLSADGYDWKMEGEVMTLTIGSLLICLPIDPPGKKWRTMLYERPEQIEQ